MATQTEKTVVNAAAVVQGIALVTFPAASTILTDPTEYDLSNTQYGFLFLPQVITAITAALLGAGLGRPFRDEARVPRRPRRESPRDGAAPRELVPHGRPRSRVRTAAAGDGEPRGRLRLLRAGAQHVHGGVQPDRGRPLDPGAERAARPGDGAGPGLRGDLRRPRLLVGPAAPVGDPARGCSSSRACVCRCKRGRAAPPRRRRGS